jgi:uncharacterized protein (DUF1778 family)
MKISTLKDGRLNIRCNLRARQLLDKAAAYMQVSVSEFVLSHAVASAEQIVQEREAISLNPDDFRAFLDALDAPSQPSDALVRALSNHAKRVTP